MSKAKYRIIVIDDNPAVHEDYRKVLCPSLQDHKLLDDLEALLFDQTPEKESPEFEFEIDSAYQGQVGFELVQRSLENDQSYHVAFIDMRMPPGWNGLRTAKEIWNIDPNLPIVICTAYADHTWEQIVAELPRSELLLILKKPFDNIELKQMAMSQSKMRSLVELAESAGNQMRTALGN